MSEPKITYLGPAGEADTRDRRMNTQWKLVPVEPTSEQRLAVCMHPDLAAALYRSMIKAAPEPAGAQPEVVAVIDEEGEHFKETVVVHRPGIDALPVGTELVDRAHVTRLTAERNALQQLLNAADQRVDELTAELAKFRQGPCKLIVGDELP
ncbi:hypothetical protein [Pseudomonas sp. Sample_22]|uniref:hypothetical protein n=1 Tax=Pseudomonas sp. Sample_22 TaxID=2448266 RepID=UPI0010329B91|nr:hypothetical protein [Pseudomonas sp. Sample_22]